MPRGLATPRNDETAMLGLLCEACELILDLDSEFACVRKNKHSDLVWFGVNLLKHSQYKHRGLPHATLGLADDIHPQDRLRDTLVLHFGRVLEATIHDRAQQLGLEEEILEA